MGEQQQHGVPALLQADRPLPFPVSRGRGNLRPGHEKLGEARSVYLEGVSALCRDFDEAPKDHSEVLVPGSESWVESLGRAARGWFLYAENRQSRPLPFVDFVTQTRFANI